MNKFAKEKFQSLCSRLAASYGVQDVSADMFDVSVPMAIRLISEIQQSNAFFQRVSSIPVTDIKGEIIMLMAPSSIAGRTDTDTKDRVPQVVGDMTGRTYECKKTDYDVALKYATLDAFARFSDCDKRILNLVYARMALDLLTIGWYGESAAKDTNRTTYPLLQDVNCGWLHDLKTNKAANFIKASEGAKIKLGKGGDWKNLDHAAYDLLSLIPVEHRTGRETVLVGREVVAWECGKMFETHGGTPTEKSQFAVMTKTYGGMPATTPACFPDKGIMVVDPANLQYYFQNSSIRRQMKDNPKRDRIEHYQSVNDCFRIGDLDAAAAVNYADIEFIDEPASVPGSSAENPLFTKTVTDSAGA